MSHDGILSIEGHTTVTLKEVNLVTPRSSKERGTHLSVLSPNVEPACSGVVLLYNLHTRHEARNAHIVVVVLE